MNKVRTYCLLLVLLVLIGWGGSRAAPAQAIGPFNEGLASSEPEEHPVDRIEAAKVTGKITPDEAALYKLYAFAEPDKLPSQFQFKGPVTEWPRLSEVNSSLIAISLMVNEIKKDWDILEPKTKDAILNYKPAKQQATPICLHESTFTHFKVCYSSAATATEAYTLGEYLEEAWDYITKNTSSGGLGFEMPDIPATKPKIPVKLAEGPYKCNLISIDRPATSFPGAIFYNLTEFRARSLHRNKALVTHELFHQAQWEAVGLPSVVDEATGECLSSVLTGLFTSFIDPHSWWIESTAVWAESNFAKDELEEKAWYTVDNDWAVKPFLKTTDYSLNLPLITDRNRPYGVVLFPVFLEATFNRDIIHSIWYTDPPYSDAVDEVLQNSYGTDLADVFQDFSAANYIKTPYPDHTHWPADVKVVPQDEISLSILQPEQGNQGLIYSLGTRYIKITGDNFKSPYNPLGTKLHLKVESSAFMQDIPGAPFAENISIVKSLPGGAYHTDTHPTQLHTEVEEILFDGDIETNFGFDSSNTPYKQEIVTLINNVSWENENGLFANYHFELIHPDGAPPTAKVRTRRVKTGGGCPVEAIDINVRDGDAGLALLWVHKPGEEQVSYNLDLAEPKADPTLRHTEQNIDVLKPGQSTAFTFWAEDQAGNVSERVDYSHKYTGPSGCDHPDDNYSAADAQVLDRVIPAGARERTRIAILDSGYSSNTAEFIEELGEPVDWLDLDFGSTAAALAETYPVLIIPSGGLYGLENSNILKARLEAYAEAGGTIIAFAQQHGYEFSVLPGAAPIEGGGLSGYGWREDTSCYSASLLLTTLHPALSGFDQSVLTAYVDGYFTHYPEDSIILLTRTQNGQPGTLMYPYGQGQVVVTSMYDDWGAANGQVSVGTRTFVRDLLSWAVEPADIPAYAPGEAISLSVALQNETRYEAAAVRLDLISPARDIIGSQVITAALSPDGSTTLDFDVSPLLPPAPQPLGIWRVDATLLDADGSPLTARAQAARFAISDPPETIAPTRDFGLSITASADRLLKGMWGEFTFHLYNYTNEEQTVTLGYGAPHHSGFVVANREHFFYGKKQEITIPAQDEAQFSYGLTVLHNDTLYGRIETAAGNKAYAYNSFYKVPAQIYIQGSIWRQLATRTFYNWSRNPLQPTLQRGDEFVITGDLVNRNQASGEVELVITAEDAAGQVIYSDTAPAILVADTATIPFSFTMTIPPEAASGYGKISLVVQHLGGWTIGADSARFIVPNSPLIGDLDLSGGITPGADNVIPVLITNTSSVLNVNTGQLTLSLVAPDDTLLSASSPFTLGQKQSALVPVTLTAPDIGYPWASSDPYRLEVEINDEYGERAWSTELPISLNTRANSDRSSYRAGESAAVDLTLYNPSHFVQNLTLDVGIEALNFGETRSLTLLPFQKMVETYSISISTTVQAGNYGLYVTATLPGEGVGSQQSNAHHYVIHLPSSKIEATVSDPPGLGDNTLSLNLLNSGAVNTSVNYNLNVYDVQGLAVANISGADLAAPIDQPQSVSSVLPDQLKGGDYHVLGEVQDLSSGETIPINHLFNLAGVNTELEAYANAEAYLTSDPIQVTALITNTGAPLAAAQLDMQIVAAGDQVETAEWVVYTTGNSGLANDQVNDAAVDGQNNKWFLHNDRLSVLSAERSQWQSLAEGGEGSTYRSIAVSGSGSGIKWIGTSSGVLILNDNNTPFDDSDDTWLPLEDPGEGGLCVQGKQINDIAVDAAGRIWFATNNNGLCVLDDNQTPLNLNDDTWGHFVAEEGGLDSNSLLRLTLDANGRVWAVSSYSLHVLGYGASPFDGSGDTWANLNIPGLGEDPLTALSIDDAGRKWLGVNYGGLYVLNDGGTPFDTENHSWTHYNTANSDLINNDIWAIAGDREGNVWIGTEQGVSIFLPDQSWRNYTPLDGLGSGRIKAITVDAEGNRWLATHYDDGVYDGEVVNLPGGVTAAIGPGLPAPPAWEHFTSENSGLGGNDLSALAADQLGNLWTAGSQGGGGGAFAGPRGVLASPLPQAYNPFLSRRSAGGDWTTFYPPYYSDFSRADLTVDAAGEVWLALQNGYEGDLYVLSPDSETWDTRRPAELSGPPGALAVEGATIWAAFDPRFGEGLEPEGIAAYDLTSQTWTVYYQGSSDSDDDHPAFRDVAIDPNGDKWFATNYGVRQLLADHTTWITYTAQNSGLASNNVHAAAIDRQGHRWFAAGNVLSVLSADSAQWASFNYNASTLAVDSQGRIWMDDGSSGAQVLDYGASPFDPTDDTLTAYNDAANLGDASVRAIVVDGLGDAWFAADNGLHHYDIPDSVVGGVLWEHHALLDAASPETLQEIANLTASELGVTGKLYLEADLSTSLGQPLDSDRYPFYIFPTETALLLEADKAIYRPGETMTLSGEIRNGAAVDLSDQILTLYLNEEVVYIEEGISIPAGSSYPFSVLATTPSSAGELPFRASLGSVTVEDRAIVATPALDLVLSAPEIVGREPFSISLKLSNPTLLDLNVSAGGDGLTPQTVAIPAGEIRVIAWTGQITADTNFNLQITGDVSTNLEALVEMGEAATIDFELGGLYPAGRLEIPYIIENSGDLAATFPLEWTLIQEETVLQSGSENIVLPLEDTVEDALHFDLPAGNYQLHYQSPFEAGSLEWQMAPKQQVSLAAEIQPFEEGSLSLEVTVANSGAGQVSGLVQVETDFDATEAYIELAPGQVYSLELSLDARYAFPITQPLTLTLRTDNGNILAQMPYTITIPEPELRLVTLPDELLLTAGEVSTLTFEVENAGNTAGEAILNFNFSDLADEAQSVWLEPGERVQFAFSFYVPVELVARDYVASYVLTNSLSEETITGDLTLTVAGVDLAVNAGLDQPLYNQGDTAALTLAVTNQNAFSTTALFAVARYGDFEATQPFTLTANETRDLLFNVPLDFSNGDTIFYGLYETDSTRAIHLNTIHIYQRYPSATLYTDRQVYQPGDTVQATIITTATGALQIEAPGYSQTLTLNGNDAGFSFTLPSPLVEGSYDIHYTLIDCSCEGEGETRVYRFDVAGTNVVVTQASLDHNAYTPEDSISLDLVIASNQSPSVTLYTYIMYPDGTQSEALEQITTLNAIENNHLTQNTILRTEQAGIHRLVYLIYDAVQDDLLLAAGSEFFDVGPIVLLGLSTDQMTYELPDEAVTARLEVYATTATNVDLVWNLDNQQILNQPTNLITGFQTIEITLVDNITPGYHKLDATLPSESLTSQASTRFVYGVKSADLDITNLWVLEDQKGITRTVYIMIDNQGDITSNEATVALYNGDPAVGGGLIGQAVLDSIDPDENHILQIEWDIQGQGGSHTIYAVADTLNTVPEFNEDNNQIYTTVILPHFDLIADTAKDIYQAGEAVSITTQIINLQDSHLLSGVLTTTVSNALGMIFFEDVQNISLAAEQQQDLEIMWDTLGLSNGDYLIQQVLVADDGETAEARIILEVFALPTAGYKAIPVVGTSPLTVTFIDQSIGSIITHTWDFGDGATQTVTDTFTTQHIYTTPGLYTVSLTVYDLETYNTLTKPNYITVSHPGAEQCTAGYVVWANSQTRSNALYANGSFNIANAKIRSNNDITIVGTVNAANVLFEYVSAFNAPAGVGDTLQVSPGSPPIAYNLSDYNDSTQPGSPAQIAQNAGKYQHINGDLIIDTPDLTLDGLYYVEGNVILQGNNLSGNVTIVAEGEIEVSSASVNFSPYIDGLLFFANGVDVWPYDALTIRGSSEMLRGVLYAPNGVVDLSSAATTVQGSVIADGVKLNGSLITLDYSEYCKGTVNPGGDPSPTPTPLSTNTPTPTPVPTNTSTPTPTPDAGSCTASAWESNQVYTAGDVVSHNGQEWRAKWWTQGEEPGTTGQWGVWEDLGPCVAGTSTPTPVPTNTPTPTPTPDAGSCTASAWESNQVYTAGDVVSHNGQEWRAKWWTQGEEPGTTGQWGVWEDLGPCTTGTQH